MSLQWKSEFSVNVPEVDNQHQKLVKMVGELDKAMREGKGKDVLGEILVQVIKYTQYHFATEEKLMTKSGYPDAAKHREEHNQLIRTVANFKAKFDKGAITLSIDVMGFLENWLANHILVTDKSMGKHLCAARVEA